MSDAINKFIERTKTANARRSKDVVLPINEAIDLSLALTDLLNQRAELLKDIVELQKRANVGSSPNISGGTF